MHDQLIQLESAPEMDERDRKAIQLWPDLTTSVTLSILNASPDCIKIVELDGSLSFMNHNGLCAMEIDDFGMVEGQAWPCLWPEEATETLEASLEAARRGETTRFEAFCPTARGSDRWWEVTVAPVRDEKNIVQRILASSRDVTERVLSQRELSKKNLQLEEQVTEADRLLAENQTLLGEIDHRVKNSFSLIAGILRLQARGTDDGSVRDALQAATNRIETLAKVHEQLHLDASAGTIRARPYLHSLLQGLAGSVASTLKLGHVAIADVELVSSEAVGLGLMVAELVGNALKHGTRDDVCKIDLELTCDDLSNRQRLVLRDYGCGLPDGFDSSQSKGLGMRVCRIYAQQLNGSFSFDNHGKGGAQFTLDFQPSNPIARKAA